MATGSIHLFLGESASAEPTLRVRIAEGESCPNDCLAHMTKELRQELHPDDPFPAEQAHPSFE